MSHIDSTYLPTLSTMESLPIVWIVNRTPPSVNHISARRTERLCQHFSHLGFRTVSFHAQPSNLAGFGASQNSHDDTIPTSATFYSTFPGLSRPSGLLSALAKLLFLVTNAVFADYGLLWLPFLRRSFLHAYPTYPPSLIIYSAAPYLCSVTHYLIPQLQQVPFALDIRDLWIDSPTHPYLHYPLYRTYAHLFLSHVQHRLLSAASFFITISPSYASFLQDRFPLSKTSVVYNNLTPSQASQIALIPKVKSPYPSSHISITYAGAIYGNRDIAAVLNILCTQYFSHRHVVFTYMGSAKHGTFSSLSHLSNLTVNISGYVSHDFALQTCLSSDLNLILISTAPSDHVTNSLTSAGILTAKLFESLEFTNPQLLLAPRHFDVYRLFADMNTADHILLASYEQLSHGAIDLNSFTKQGAYNCRPNILPSPNSTISRLSYDSLSSTINELMPHLRIST